MSSSLVSIGKKKLAEAPVSRRSFLKVLGATTATTVATGCADPHKENIFPHFKGEENVVPGVAVWYASTCLECSAGCGIQVRTREGRTVKVEGNPEHPINRGGLCGLGQSALQAVYDPDRIREPLQRVKGEDSVGNPKVIFKPISWNDALAKVATALVEPNKKKYLFSGEVTGTMSDLLADFVKSFGVSHAVYDPMEAVDVAEASELVFGSYGVPSFKFDRADVVVSFGADFLETWISPCEYARDWATKRKSDKPQMVFQVEPRMSLTAAKADKWVSINPGTEVRLALALLKQIFSNGASIDFDTKNRIAKLVSDISLDAVAAETGVPVESILLMAERLTSANESLVVAGSAQSRSKSSAGLQVAVALINLVLGNVGKTVQLTKMRKPNSSLADVAKALPSIENREASVVMFYGTNPLFSLPSAFKAQFALEKAKPGLVVSFSSHLDETTEMADIILPIHHSLEDWGDHVPFAGVRNLVQPTMLPLFDSRSFGDLIILLARSVNKDDVNKGHKVYADYLKAAWQTFFNGLPSKSGDFPTFWRRAVEAGGYFQAGSSSSVSPKISSAAFDVSFTKAELDGKGAEDGLTLVPFFSVKSFDGRAANRPWLQEIPDPMSLVYWDSWGEVHPETAAKLGFKTGDFASVRNFYGELNIPLVVTQQVKPGTIAVPVGQGHHAYGRYAKIVGGGNVFDLLGANSENRVLATVGMKVSLLPSSALATMIQAQITEDQHDRKIARTRFLDAQGKKVEKKDHGGHHMHGEPKQMYDQRKHPLYQWGMVVDLAACTGCSACIVACYAENNIAIVGKKVASMGREMSWLSIHKYVENEGEEFTVSLQPMMCQHCQNAPCEPVCPVYATYHNEEGLNAMVYNRCVGTRYCSNNCSYKVRRFNWYEFDLPDTYQWQLNPDVTRRTVGIMEKCTFCVQRINEAKDKAKDKGEMVKDGEVKPACVQSCPTQALTFGNLLDADSKVSKMAKHERGYKVLDAYINTLPSVTYLEDVKYKV